MICNLCNIENDLQNSHIIPEFVFKQLYDSKGRFHVLSTLENRPRPLEQKGIREKLLCRKCEQKLSKYEKYASEILLGGEEFYSENIGNHLKISKLNYQKFKLFLLSILWRSSISSHAMFSRVNLGPHEDKVKKLIYDENPGSELDYPCIIYGLTSKENIHSSLIDQPRRFHTNGHITYRFIFSGFMWVYYVTSHKLPKELLNIVLNKNGEMIVGKGSYDELTEFNYFAKKLSSMGRLSKPTK